jgi:hypothetical protein
MVLTELGHVLISHPVVRILELLISIEVINVMAFDIERGLVIKKRLKGRRR